MQDMMNGTLETKKDVFSEANSMIRPVWMDEIPRSKMNESQVKEFDAFENKIKQIQEEQIKYNKNLEIEYKKLRNEITEVLTHSLTHSLTYSPTHSGNAAVRRQTAENEQVEDTYSAGNLCE